MLFSHSFDYFMIYLQIPPRNPRINLDHDTRFMYKHCNKTLFFLLQKHSRPRHNLHSGCIILVDLNTLHSAATFLQISYSQVTWRNLYCRAARNCR